MLGAISHEVWKKHQRKQDTPVWSAPQSREGRAVGAPAAGMPVWGPAGPGDRNAGTYGGVGLTTDSQAGGTHAGHYHADALAESLHIPASSPSGRPRLSPAAQAAANPFHRDVQKPANNSTPPAAFAGHHALGAQARVYPSLPREMAGASWRGAAPAAVGDLDRGRRFGWSV